MSKATRCPAVRGYHYTKDEILEYLFGSKKSLKLDDYPDDRELFASRLYSALQEVVHRTEALTAECYLIERLHPSYNLPIGEVPDDSIAVGYIVFERESFEVDLSDDPSYQDLRKKYTESWEQENPPDSLGLPLNPPCVLWLDREGLHRIDSKYRAPKEWRPNWRLTEEQLKGLEARDVLREEWRKAKDSGSK